MADAGQAGRRCLQRPHRRGQDLRQALHHAQSDGIHNKHWWEHVGEVLSEWGGKIAEIANELAPFLDVLALATSWIPGVDVITAGLAEADNLIALAGTGLEIAGDAMQGHWGDALMGAGMLGLTSSAASSSKPRRQGDRTKSAGSWSRRSDARGQHDWPARRRPRRRRLRQDAHDETDLACPASCRSSCAAPIPRLRRSVACSAPAGLPPWTMRVCGQRRRDPLRGRRRPGPGLPDPEPGQSGAAAGWRPVAAGLGPRHRRDPRHRPRSRPTSGTSRSSTTATAAGEIRDLTAVTDRNDNRITVPARRVTAPRPRWSTAAATVSPIDIGHPSRARGSPACGCRRPPSTASLSGRSVMTSAVA